MRDLTARLREIVRQPSAPARELTYVPEPDPSRVIGDAARRLGGTALDESGACVSIDRVWASDRSHGRSTIDSLRLTDGLPLHLFDRRVSHDDWWRRVVFFDIETTGLSGGAGTLAFLAGCAWFDEEGLRVRQFFLSGPSGEKTLLDALGRVFTEASLLVTFNGRTFDVPFMETRWAFHRKSAPTDDLPHFDMLPPARRLWRQREEATGCSLSSLEHAVLGFHRHDDVPGFEIPARYFQFLRTGDPAVVEGVLDHNRHDLVSLAALTSRALWLAREGPEACREPSEQVAIGRLYEQVGQTDAAVRAYDMAARMGYGDVRRQALVRLAVLLRRADRHDEAADAWSGVLQDVDERQGVLTAIERRAAEALAIHHEHRAKDPHEAKRYAEALNARDAEVQRRLSRLERKIQKATAAGNGPLFATSD